MSSVLVVGAGAWGAALALHLAREGRRVTLWARDPAPILATRHSSRLPGHRLPDHVAVTGRLDAAPFDAALLAVPVQHMAAVAAGLPGRAPVVACAKGMEASTLRLPLEILAHLHPGRPAAMLTGPNFAQEVAAGLPGAAVLAAADGALRTRLAEMIGSPAFRIYGNDDPMGAQLGGAAKNVIAIAAGAVIGAGLGENARAALVTRGLAEIGRLVLALGGRAETVASLSGLGDLLLTCTGASSRNFSLGLALGRGMALPSVFANRGAAVEGVATAPALVARACGVDLPICAAVAALLNGRWRLEEAIAALLARPWRDE